MKTVLSILATLLLANTLFAQEDVSAEGSPTAARELRAAQRKFEAERRAKEALEGKTILVYGGFFVDLSKAEKKSKFLSLRQPRDPVNDYRHIYYDERNSRPKGFVLFSLGF